MLKWIAALAVAAWAGQSGLTGFSLNHLAMYREYFMALGLALVITPWFVRQLDS